MTVWALAAIPACVFIDEYEVRGPRPDDLTLGRGSITLGFDLCDPQHAVPADPCDPAEDWVATPLVLTESATYRFDARGSPFDTWIYWSHFDGEVGNCDANVDRFDEEIDAGTGLFLTLGSGDGCGLASLTITNLDRPDPQENP